MTAKEMFEKLGYKYDKRISDIRYFKKDVYFIKEIIFEETDKEVYIADPLCIEIDLFKAIHQQLKELGWLDE